MAWHLIEYWTRPFIQMIFGITHKHWYVLSLCTIWWGRLHGCFISHHSLLCRCSLPLHFHCNISQKRKYYWFPMMMKNSHFLGLIKWFLNLFLDGNLDTLYLVKETLVALYTPLLSVKFPLCNYHYSKV